MEPVPRPASLEKIPRETPFFILRNMLPTTPPVTACMAENAPLKDGNKYTGNIAGYSGEQRSKSQEDIKKCHKRYQLFCYLSDPFDTAKQDQGNQNGNDDTNDQIGDCDSLFLGDHMLKFTSAELMAVVMVLTCVAFPVPNTVRTPNAANRYASQSHFLPRPFLM